MTVHKGSSLVSLGLALALALTGCAANPAEPPDPTPSGLAPDAAFTADIAAGPDGFKISYRLTNRSTEDLIALYGPEPPTRPDRNAVSIIATAVPGRIQIAKRAFAKPPNYEEMQESMAGGVIVGPGASVAEQLFVPTPVRSIAPFANIDGVPLPDPITEVVFCVGVLRLREAQVASNDGSVVTVTESAATTSVQHLFCSAPYRVAHN
jgi:hypothetical protein